MNPRWDQQIKVNRVEYDSMMQGLCSPISKDLCPIILRLEHTVAELSKLSDQNQGEGEGGERKMYLFSLQMIYSLVPRLPGPDLFNILQVSACNIEMLRRARGQG